MRREKLLPQLPPLTPSEQKLCDLVDTHQNDIKDLLCRLLEYDSRTYDSDTYSDLHPITNFVQKWFSTKGLSTALYESPHRTNTGLTWPNLISTLSMGDPKSGKTLNFMGHLDIVPFSPAQWDPAYPPLAGTEREGKIFGRGAVDMKGGVSALMMAQYLLAKSALPFTGTIRMICTPDEEIDGHYGARFLAGQHFDKVSASATIIAEPTGQPPIKSPSIIMGEKGANWFKLTFHGAAGHGSQPKPKSNALNKAARFIALAPKHFRFHPIRPPMTQLDLIHGLLSRYRLQDLVKKEPKSDTNKTESYNEDTKPLAAFFTCTCSCNMIHAGTKVNVIPDTCELFLDVRILPGISPPAILRDLTCFCNYLGYHIHFPTQYEQFSIPPPHQHSYIRSRLVDIEVEIISMNAGGLETRLIPICRTLSHTFSQVYQVQPLYFFSPGMTDASHFRRVGMDNILVFGPSGEKAHDANEFVYLEDVVKCTKVYLLTAYQFLQ